MPAIVRSQASNTMLCASRSLNARASARSSTVGQMSFTALASSCSYALVYGASRGLHDHVIGSRGRGRVPPHVSCRRQYRRDCSIEPLIRGARRDQLSNFRHGGRARTDNFRWPHRVIRRFRWCRGAAAYPRRPARRVGFAAGLQAPLAVARSVSERRPP